MPDPIEFYFDYSSPFGYLASEQIDAIAARHDREVSWKPFLMGVVFKAIGTRPLVEIPLKGDYSRHDVVRAARGLGLRFTIPPGFPFLSVAACRASYWALDRDPQRAKRMMQSLFRKAWIEGGDITKPGAVIAAAESVGFDGTALSAALHDPVLKERLRQEMDATMQRGVFGSPFFLVDGEPFWGHDRLPMVERWLETGGW